MSGTLLRVGAIMESSLANGPGERFVVWTQGCSLACAGCFNEHLWPAAGGEDWDTSALAARINARRGLRGVTISGGEPLQQPEAVCDLLARLAPGLDSVIFTGYARAELESDARRGAVLRRADLIVAGRFMLSLATDANPWAGSSNKEVLALTGRVRADEFPAARVEAVIGADGLVQVTGFPPPRLSRRLGGR